MMKNKKLRNLDGVYFRVKREEKWENICFSDLTKQEQKEILANKDNEWLKRMCIILAGVISDLGEQFDLVVSNEENFD